VCAHLKTAGLTALFIVFTLFARWQ